MLLKNLGARFGTGGTTPAGATVVRSQLAPLGVRPSVVDGSGLSRSNRTTPRQVVRLLTNLAGNEDFFSSLATAGRNGTLAKRMRGTAARDRCRGKTGTLSNVSALAGYCRTRSGRTLAFAILMNGVNPAGARRLQDRMAAAMAGYRGP
jgi:D-alanyl-D-alanine carboxypeptidase/D-alanyl-D-alanine-endopeptidase (penicillin-binding protein 4)